MRPWSMYLVTPRRVAGVSIEPMPSVVESNEMPTKLAGAEVGTLR